VDGFSYGKATPEIRYIYFLSHFHAGTPPYHNPFNFNRPLDRVNPEMGFWNYLLYSFDKEIDFE